MNGKGFRGVAQLASASGLGPEGPVFESQYPDFKKSLTFVRLFFCRSTIRFPTPGKAGQRVITGTFVSGY